MKVVGKRRTEISLICPPPELTYTIILTLTMYTGRTIIVNEWIYLAVPLVPSKDLNVSNINAALGEHSCPGSTISKTKWATTGTAHGGKQGRSMFRNGL